MTGLHPWDVVDLIDRSSPTILGSKKWPSVIGNESVINWVKEAFFIQKKHVDVPESKSLAPDIQNIKRAVCCSYNVAEEDLLKSKRGMKNEPRNAAIFLMRNLMGSKLVEIGQEFGISNYSSVSTVIERTKQRAFSDRKFRKRIEKVKSDLKVSQEQT